MAVKYYMYSDDKPKAERAAATGEAVEISLRDEDYAWYETKSLISRQPFEGAEPAGFIGPGGAEFEEGEWFVKILESRVSLED